jgi:hypothetical protein
MPGSRSRRTSLAATRRRQRPCSTATWPPHASITPLGPISPRTGPGRAARAHPPYRVGVSPRLWPDVFPIDVRIPRQLRPTEREPTKGLVGAGCPSVHLTARPTHPVGVDPFTRCRDRVPHPATLHDQAVGFTTVHRAGGLPALPAARRDLRTVPHLGALTAALRGDAHDQSRGRLHGGRAPPARYLYRTCQRWRAHNDSPYYHMMVPLDDSERPQISDAINNFKRRPSASAPESCRL